MDLFFIWVADIKYGSILGVDPLCTTLHATLRYAWRVTGAAAHRTAAARGGAVAVLLIVCEGRPRQAARES